MSMLRTTLARQTRFFGTHPRLQKSAVESVKETVKKADRTVADAAVKGIEKGEQAAQKVKEATPGLKGEAKGKAEELTGEAKGKASELSGKAKGTAEEVKGKVS